MTKSSPQLLISDKKGKIYSLADVPAAGMKGGHFFPLYAKDLIKLPSGSELFMLPQRIPVGFDVRHSRPVFVRHYPFSHKKAPCFAVAAFISPGFTLSYNSAYREIAVARTLPLFSYAACAFYRGEFYVAALRVDRERRQDLRLMDPDRVKQNADRVAKLFAQNRLIRHLQNCALLYGCPAAKNFFLQRDEAPLPTSPLCNARCIGCISHQPNKLCPVTQPRISFVPQPEEVAEVALFHLHNVPDAVVSFGQGCEGEPLLAGRVLEESIKLIRKKTSRGFINLNTNASLPGVLARLFDAGLDSIRVSLNSARTKYYTRYYRPRGYSFTDVRRSIKMAKKKQGFVSLNYLVLPGFTDSREEFSAFKNFVAGHHIDMIQWRNLNFDPLRYFRLLKVFPDKRQLMGVTEVIGRLKKEFPQVLTGYFNPSRLRIKRKV